MSWIIYALHGGVAQSDDEREFDGELTMMFGEGVRVSHQYTRGMDICLAVAIPSIDFLNFETTRTVDEKGGQVYVSLASASEVRDRLFIRESSVAGQTDSEPGDDDDFDAALARRRARLNLPPLPAGEQTHKPCGTAACSFCFPRTPAQTVTAPIVPHPIEVIGTPVNLGNVADLLNDHEARLNRIEVLSLPPEAYSKPDTRNDPGKPHPNSIHSPGCNNCDSPHVQFAQEESDAAT